MVKRESNIELLRIIAMLYILLHHLIVHALCPNILYGKGELTADYALYSVLEGFFYVVVNIFLLISGYFGIRLRARKIWSLYLQCAFYGFCTYLFGVSIGSVPLVPHTFITKSLLIFSHASSWWFVALYFMLMIISPFLNYSMKIMTKKQYSVALLGLTFVIIYLGWFWQKSIYDATGYSLINFIYVYLIGGYLQRFENFDNIKSHRKLTIVTYVICALIFGGCNILRLYTDIPFGNLWGYNNPIVILGAIGLFLFVRSFKFESNIVNYIGGGGIRFLSLDGYKLYRELSLQNIWGFRTNYICFAAAYSYAVYCGNCATVGDLRNRFVKGSYDAPYFGCVRLDR